MDVMDSTGSLLSTEQNRGFRCNRRLNCDIKSSVISSQSSIHDLNKNTTKEKHKGHIPLLHSKRTNNCWRMIIVKFFFVLQILYFSAGPDVLAFNLDVYYPTVISIHEKDSYFGYSVEMFADDRDESW